LGLQTLANTSDCSAVQARDLLSCARAKSESHAEDHADKVDKGNVGKNTTVIESELGKAPYSSSRVGLANP